MDILVIVVGVVLLLGISFVAYYGGFQKVKIRAKKQGGEVLVYKEMQGDYSKSGKLISEISSALLTDYKIDTCTSFGIYYDDPKKVEKENLRSEIGCILEKKDRANLTVIEEKYKSKSFPEKIYLVTEFPYRGKLSIFVSLLKVYPVFNRFVKEKGYKKEGVIMEIYDIPNKKIRYRKEILK